ncbi:MAG: hypothetical protein ACO3CV_05235 [Steroidobacteraceae bacterium]
MDHGLWVFIHVMLLVYWLGGDLGVFLLARSAKRAELSVAERLFALRMAVQIDLIPRLCFAVMLPVGLQVTASGGYAVIPSAVLLASWGFALVWITLLIAMGRAEGSPRAAVLARANLALQLLALLVIGYFGITAWLGLGPLPGGWYAAKIILFALIFATSIGIDLAFRPVAPAFIRLAQHGSEPGTEATITGAIDAAIRWVLALYALLIVIAFLGITKAL